MFKQNLSGLLLLVFILCGMAQWRCNKKDVAVGKTENKAAASKRSGLQLLLSFAFRSADNPGLAGDIAGTINENNQTVTARNPQHKMTKLVASFQLAKGAAAYVGTTPVVSGKTTIDYSADVVFTIFAMDGSLRKYLVRLTARILNIDHFLTTCPLEDPNIHTILGDFEIRRNGVPVVDFGCTSSYATGSSKQLTDALIWLQALRTLYYLDIGRSNYVPWTTRRLYDWVRENVQGINIVDPSGTYSGVCCDIIDGKRFIGMVAQNDHNREFRRSWEGISGSISLLLHERRHADPGGYPHTSCCGISGGCDASYSETDPGSFGVAYWFHKALLTGMIRVGVACLSPERQRSITDWLSSGMRVGRDRICRDAPAASAPAAYGDCELR